MSRNKLFRKGALGAVMAVAVMFMSILPTQMFADTTSSRLAGSDRISTASAIAGAFGAADTVILAAADDANLVDSLAVAPLAGKTSPIYLTGKNSLNSDVKAELTGKNVYVIGAISNSVFAEVQTVASSATKLSGANRIATNEAINARLTNVAGTFVVGFDAIPDALSVASFAAANNYAIVLANQDGSVDSSKLLGDKIYIVGGTSLVNDIAGATRLSGSDRFGTNEKVISTLGFTFNTVYVANGVSLVDALAGSSLAAKTGSPIIISNNMTVNNTVNSLIAADAKVVALGGAGAVSDYILSKITNGDTNNNNNNNLGSQISSYELTNNTDSEFVQDSTTLVVDDTAYFNSITVTTDGVKDKITDTEDFSITSSNPAVISVEEDTTNITAEAPGSSRITITYGSLTKQITFNVASEERKLAKVRFKSDETSTVITSLNTIIPDGEAKESIIRIEPIDQYGDKMPDEDLDCNSTNDSIMTISDSTVPSDGIITVTGVEEGTAYISVYDSDDIKKGSLLVKVSDNSEIAEETFGIYNPIDDDDCDDMVSDTDMSDFSTDMTIDVNADKYVAFRLNQYNSDGVYLGGDTTVEIDIRQSDDDVAEYTQLDDGRIIVEGLGEGTATLVVKDNESYNYYTAKITVVEEGYSIKDVSFKSLSEPTSPKNYNYKSVLNYTTSGDDPIIKGITLYNPTSQNIRLETSSGLLYLDKDDDGEYSSDDTELGYFEIVTSGDISNSPGDAEDGVDVEYGDSGTVYFKIKDADNSKVIKTTYVNVDL